MENTYTKKEKSRYLLGLSGQNIIYGIITSSLAYYLQFTILIPALWVGIILSISRIFDAIKDPFIGAMISKSNRQFKDYLIMVPIPTAILTILCFSNGVYSSNNIGIKNALIIISAFVFYIIWEIVFTMGDIPISGYPSVLTNNERDRTKLLSLRPIGSMACSLSTLAVQPIAFALSASFGGTATDERNAFLITVILFSVLGGILFQFTAVGSTQRVANKNNTKSFEYFITNPLLRKISVSGILGSLKAMTGVILSPLVTYYFASKNPTFSLLYTVLWGMGSFIGLIISMAAVPKLTAKIGTEKLYVIVNLLNIFPNVLLFFLYLEYPINMTDMPQTIVMFLFTLIIGSCVSISTTVQTLIISEAVDLEEKLSGNRPTALFFSMQTFIVKIGTGISSLAAGLGYAIIKFSSAETEELNTYIASGGIPRLNDNYSTLMTMLFFLYTIPVAISSLLSVIPFIKKYKN